MSEHAHQPDQSPKPPLPSSGEATGQSGYNFQEQLQLQAQEIPEIAEQHDAILQAGEQLIARYNLEPELFASPARSLVFSMIANHAANATEAREMDFTERALTLLAEKFSPVLDLNEKELGELSPEDELAVYEQYTNSGLSQQLSDAIANGLLDGVKERMGITVENEDAYVVRVLDADPEGQNSFGLAPNFSDWDEIPGDIHEKQRVAEQESAAYDAHVKYVKELSENAEQMQAALLEKNPLAQAFVNELGPEGAQVKNLCIMAPLAIKLLHPEEVKSTYYSEDYAIADRSLLDHEYVHTQGGLHLDNDAKFGINLEEVRAEHFSGNHQGYQNVKGFFNDLLVVTGFDVIQQMEAEPKGGTDVQMYTRLAEEFGLQDTLEILLASPQNYIELGQDREAAFTHIGGYDGVLRRIMGAKIAAGEGDAIKGRVDHKARMLLEMVDNRDFVINYYKRLGLNLIAGLLETRMQELEQQQATEQ